MVNDRRFPPSGECTLHKKPPKAPSTSRSNLEVNSSSEFFSTRREGFQIRRKELPLANLDPRITPVKPNIAPSETATQDSEEAEDYDGESSMDRRHLLWTNEMDDCFIDKLLEEKLKGQKISGSFTKNAYREAARAVSNLFNISCSSDQVKNRVKTLKKHLADSKDIWQASGFGFNYSTGMFEAEGKVWDVYLKAKLSHSYLRHTPVRNFEKLDVIFGKDRATGKRAIGPKQRQQQWEMEGNDTCDAKEDLNNEISSSSKAAPSGSSKQSQEKKGTRIIDLVSEEIKSIKEGLDVVAAALDRGNIRNFSEAQLFEENEKIDGMSKISQMQTYQNLTENVGAARAFLACPIERIKLWFLFLVSSVAILVEHELLLSYGAALPDSSFIDLLGVVEGP